MKYLLKCLLILCTHSLFAQVQESSNEFVPVVVPSVSFGTSMPFGSYAASDPDNNYSSAKGFADPGSAFEIGFLFQVRKNFGLTVGFNYFNNPMNVERFGEYLNKYYEGNNLSDYQYRVKATSWRNNSFLVGLAFRTPEKRASVQLDFRFGMLTSRSPEIRVDSIDAAGNVLNKFKSESEMNFTIAFSPGIKFKIRLVDPLYFDISTSVLFAPSIGNINDIYPEVQPLYYYNEPSNHSINLMSFNVMGGLSYEFPW